MVGSGAPQRGSAAAAASMRRRKPSGSSSGGGASGGGAAGSMLQFYTDDAPGLKISPNVVLVMSIGFIAFVAVLHVMGKLYFVKTWSKRRRRRGRRSSQMAASAESSSEMEDAHSPTIPQSQPLLSTIPSANIAATTVENAASWIDDAMRQALVYQNTIVETLDSTIDASRTRLSQIRDTSIAHTSQTIDSLREIASEFSVYEHMVFAKIKEGVNVAASHPLMSGSLAFGVGIFALKKTRRFVYYNTLRMFSSEEALLSRADLRVKELRQSMDRLTAESEKLERISTVAEDELIRGRMKLRQAGKQIRGVVQSAYKIENQAAGLKDVLKELPTREASRFRSQISNRASEIKQERKALTKEVNKISNYGISV
ncbi:hypothetical protein HID58_052430 [Brassica napus]|uniref:Uncharacterized protein n=2 Tax=Brassica napus TaxID=3708 RepID=A0ABQ8ACZ6_BRANA|nr:hypothetical protein HID58_052430 [Brassica napus]